MPNVWPSNIPTQESMAQAYGWILNISGHDNCFTAKHHYPREDFPSQGHIVVFLKADFLKNRKITSENRLIPDVWRTVTPPLPLWPM
jgi:hypothetical protein